MTSIERIYKTKAYDKLEAFCDDEQGGDSSFVMSDKYDRQQVVNLLLPIIRNELKQTTLNTNKTKEQSNTN